MATSNARIDPQPKDMSEGELGNLSPSEGRSNPGGSSSPDVVQFAEEMLRRGEAYAAWKSQPPSPAPETEARSMNALQQDQTRMGQQREESQSLDALRGDQQQTGQMREERQSLAALHPTQAANDNQPLQRDGREALFRPNELQPGAQEHTRDREMEEDRSADRDGLLSGQSLAKADDPQPITESAERNGDQEEVRSVDRDSHEQRLNVEASRPERESEEIVRDGREELFRPDAPGQDAQEPAQTQERERERQIEMDR